MLEPCFPGKSGRIEVPAPVLVLPTGAADAGADIHRSGCGRTHNSDPIRRVSHPAVTRTVSAAEHLLLAGFYSVSDDAAATVSTVWRQLMNGALEAVEHMGAPVRTDFKTLVVFVAAHFALGHNVLCRRRLQRQCRVSRRTRIAQRCLRVVRSVRLEPTL